MKASEAAQRILLDLADLDRRIVVAESRRKNPPAAARIAELTAIKQEQSRELAFRVGVHDDAQRELSRLETDVDLARTRRERDQQRLATASDPKQAVALEGEIAALTNRLASLEDTQLEIMERVEAAEAAVAEQRSLIDTTNDEGQRLTVETRALIESTTTEIEELTRDRTAVAATVPEALLSMYGRVGAGLLTRNTCGACNMQLNATDLHEVRATPWDDVAFCPECGAIMVRTEESGLI